MFNCLRMGCYLLVLSVNAFAIDNPDAPDLRTPFLEREKSYLESMDEATGLSASDASRVASSYEAFLDAELNKIYKHLMSVLPASSKPLLRQSQLRWIAFRDAEFRYIELTWTREQFGSSADITEGSHRTAVIRARIEQLLHQSAAFLADSEAE